MATLSMFPLLRRSRRSYDARWFSLGLVLGAAVTCGLILTGAEVHYRP